MTPRPWLIPFAILALGVVACDGNLNLERGEEGAESGAVDGVPHHDSRRYTPPATAAQGGLKRLAPREFDAALSDLLDVGADYGKTYLPDIGGYFFDNNFASYSAQNPSSALVDSLELIAQEVAEAHWERLREERDYRDAFIGCQLSDGEPCYREWVARFGRRALRRPLTSDEVDNLVAQFWNLEGVEADAREQAGNLVRIRFTVEYFIQHPEFIYRNEQGSEVDGLPGIYKLDDYEVASRLSFFLWGTIPSDDLLRKAEAGELTTPEQVRSTAREMLDDPRALAQMQRFHAMWLGYRSNSLPADLRDDAITETDALVERVVSQDVDWRTLFTSNQSYINERLAEHYDLEWSGGGDFEWVAYPPKAPRAGILSHASFLSLGTQGDDTSIIFRGVNLLERVVQCQELHPPDLANVEKGEPIEPASNCELDLVNADTLTGGCSSCHYQINYMGAGLESFDAQGRYRTTYSDKPDCPMPEGAVMRPGADGWRPAHTFNGPASLGQLLVEQPDLGLERCAVGKLYEFAVGYEGPAASEVETIDMLARGFAANGYEFRELVLDLVASPAFRYRTDLTVDPNH